MVQSSPNDDRLKWGLQAFLLIIMYASPSPFLTITANQHSHRASAVEQNARVSRIQAIVQPVIEAWQDPGLTEVLSTFPGFCRVVGLEGLPEYLSSRDFASAQDWSSAQLDEEGRARQDQIQSRTKVVGLGSTFTFIADSPSTAFAVEPDTKLARGHHRKAQRWLSRLPSGCTGLGAGY